jgi:hypothetical protein
MQNCFTVVEQNDTFDASLIALVARLVASTLAGIIAACFGVLARRLSRYDYEIHLRYEVMTQRRQKIRTPCKGHRIGLYLLVRWTICFRFLH